MVKLIPQPRRRERGADRSWHRRRAVAVASIFSLGIIATMTSAMALPRGADHPETFSAHGAFARSQPDGARVSGLQTHVGNITITEPGTVVDAMYVRGAINVRADDVTIRNSVVAYTGYHSIRIFPGADGTRILNTDVYCMKARTNGVVFGNYYAENVALHGCRNNFMYSDRKPAEIVASTVDGTPFETAPVEDAGTHGPIEAGPDKSPRPEASPDVESSAEASPDPEPSRQPSPDPEPSAEASPDEEPSTEASPDPEPSRQPTPDPEPSRQPTPDPEPTQPSQPAHAGFPDASSTGVPDGVSLTRSGNVTVTRDGTVLDGLHVRGRIIIAADNVTVRNTLIEGGGGLYPIQVEGGTSGALIEHVEIDNLGDTGIGILMSGSGTIRYADIHSAEDGIRIQSDDVTVEYSYIHDLQRQPGGHHDTIQIRNGDNVTLRGNNLQAYVAATDDPMNAALQIGSLLGSDRISNLLVVGNLMNGGNFTINAGGRGEVDSARYSRNQFGRDFRYGVVGNLEEGDWESTNVWFDTGEPVR